MEYRALTVAARENLRTTYIGLALALPGARLVHDRAPTVCVGPGLPTFANFAMEFDDEDAWSRTRNEIRTAEIRPDRFWAFLNDADLDDRLRSRLMQDAFLYRHRLAMMAWEGSVSGEIATLRMAESRKEVAEFMVRQFFRASAPEMREAIVQSTVHSQHQLRFIGAGAGCIGAVMTVETPGVLGLYNLCVDGSHRGLGRGAAIVRAVQSEASAANRIVTLQCDELLVPWYERLGFTRIGSVETWSGIAPAPSGGDARLA
ncbi:MAG: GNAT family N-acetyltransferase [Fimbriimonadaceae bacterium]|nr:GNAT family N-acetyltransferase [Fimbriimonadaceae bacterium]